MVKRFNCFMISKVKVDSFFWKFTKTSPDEMSRQKVSSLRFQLIERVSLCARCNVLSSCLYNKLIDASYKGANPYPNLIPANIPTQGRGADHAKGTLRPISSTWLIADTASGANNPAGTQFTDDHRQIFIEEIMTTLLTKENIK